MSTEREQLELAAKACGLIIVDASHPVSLYVARDGCCGGVRWNPLTDDGDALRLAMKTGVPVYILESQTGYETPMPEIAIFPTDEVAPSVA